MDSQLLQFFGSLAAIAALIVLAHYLGFTRGGSIANAAEAHSLFQLAAGGFDPAQIALDADGRGAIARDAAGNIAVLVPHGGQFVARRLSGSARRRVEGKLLVVEEPALGAKPVVLTLGEAAQDWATDNGADR